MCDGMNDVVGSLRFIGEVQDLARDASAGDLVMYHDRVYLWTGGGWECMEAIESQTPQTPQVVRKVLMRCRSCGAPTENDGKCGYCGTWNFEEVVI